MPNKSRWRMRKGTLGGKVEAGNGHYGWAVAVAHSTEDRDKTGASWGEHSRRLFCWEELTYWPKYILRLIYIQRLLWEKRKYREVFVWKKNENGFPVERTIKIIYSNFPFFKVNDSCMKIPYWVFSYRKIYSRL